MWNRAKLYAALKGSEKLSQTQVVALDALMDLVDKDERWNELGKNALGYFLATVWHETAHTYKPIKEYRNRVGTAGRKNQDRYWLSGFYGRGLVQLTWEENYEIMSHHVGHDLVANPDLLFDLKISYDVAVIGMTKGLFTGKKFADYFSAQQNDTRNARRIINGLDKADLISAKAIAIQNALEVMPDVGKTPTEGSVQISGIGSKTKDYATKAAKWISTGGIGGILTGWQAGMSAEFWYGFFAIVALVIVLGFIFGLVMYRGEVQSANTEALIKSDPEKFNVELHHV